MKFCEKCGTQITDEIAMCPQCQTLINNHIPTNLPPQSPAKTKSIKMYFIIPLIVVFTALITISIVYFVLPNDSKSIDDSHSNSSVNNSSTDNTFTTTINDACPEDEYGHHSWESATCERPAYCWECGAYKDDKLGYHDFELDEETGLIKCWYCNMLKSDYDKE